MRIEKYINDESPEELSITGLGNDWGIRGDKLWVTVDKVNATPIVRANSLQAYLVKV